MIRAITIALAAGLLGACATTGERPAAGADADAEAPSVVDEIVTIEEFLAQHEYIRAGLQDESFGEFSDADIATIEAKQDELRDLLADVDAIEQLDVDDRIRVHNAQEAINGILARSVQDTPICRREHTLGSHRPRTVCMTPRQRSEFAAASRAFLQWTSKSTLRSEDFGG